MIGAGAAGLAAAAMLQRAGERVVVLERDTIGAPWSARYDRLHVDAVIAATGFRTGLEPLVGHLGVLDGRGEPVVHGAHEHPAAAGLRHQHYRVTLGGTLRHVGIQAKQLARTVVTSHV